MAVTEFLHFSFSPSPLRRFAALSVHGAKDCAVSDNALHDLS
jgi:hypothetical protein